MKAINLITRVYHKLLNTYSEKVIIKNYFKTDFKKTTLLSYIAYPFLKKEVNVSHSNFLEVKVIAQLFKEMGYNVDIVHYRNTKKINYDEYELIFGMGDPFENSFRSSFKGKRIFYATGAHYNTQYNAELKRISDVQQKTGVLLQPRRIPDKCWSASTVLADAMFLIGNSWTEETYRPYFKKKIYQVPVSAYNFYSPGQLKRNWETAKKNYLWIGSGGLVHKGLDLCLEAFKNTPDLNLHICGPYEADFFNLYQKELTSCPNITYYGFTMINSEKFEEIVKKCGFVIIPSCSEGQSGALITAMYTGLIPVATENNGVIIQDKGFLIKEFDSKHIEKLVQKISQTENQKLSEISEKIYSYCKREHTIKKFIEVMRKNLKEFLNLK